MKKGIYSALITPFGEDEKIDERALVWLLEWAIGKGLHGVFIVSSTGESWSLSFEEKRDLFHRTVEVVANRVLVIAGVGAPSTRDSVALTKAAEKAGVDAVCIVPPSFVRPTQKELIGHYEAIAQQTRLPILLYNIPMLAGNVLEPDGVLTLATRHSHVVGIKDSSGDLTLLNKLMFESDESFGVFTGVDTLVLPHLMAGGQGAILGSANVCPDLSLTVLRLFEAGRYEEAGEVQNRLTRFWVAMRHGSFPAPIKEAMRLCGLPAGPTRRPIDPLSESSREALRRDLLLMDVLKTGQFD